jgi:superfamily II DNA/RNA helicase
MQTEIKRCEKGVTTVVATPGRLAEMVNRGKINLSKCQFFCIFKIFGFR